MEQNTVLHTSFRGYHKIQAVLVIDRINTLIKLVEAGVMSREDAVREAEERVSKPIPKMFWGLRKKDVDSHIAERMAKLKGEVH